jgi:hypothetical protein
MMANIDEVTDNRLVALGEIEKDKIMVAKAYNKKVKAKSFQVRDLVWKTILLGMKTVSEFFGIPKTNFEIFQSDSPVTVFFENETYWGYAS